MADKKFNFFESYHRALERVPDSSYGRIVRGMARYVFEGEEPSFDEDLDNIVWELIKPILLRGQEISQVRAEAGRQGKGISRNVGNNHASKQNQSKNKTKSNQNKTDKDKEEDKEKDKEEDININNVENKKEKNALPEYVSTDFADIMRDWLAYKKERGEGYKPRGLKSCYTKLVTLSGGDPDRARAIIEQSMSNNYAGIFELKNKDNNYEHNTFRRTPADNIAAAQQAHIRAIADSISKTTERNGKVSKFLPFD